MKETAYSLNSTAAFLQQFLGIRLRLLQDTGCLLGIGRSSPLETIEFCIHHVTFPPIDRYIFADSIITFS